MDVVKARRTLQPTILFYLLDCENYPHSWCESTIVILGVTVFDRNVSLSRFMGTSEPKWKAKSRVHTGKARYLLRWKTRQRSPLSNTLELEFMFEGNIHNVDYSSLWDDIFHRWATQELLLSLGNNGATKDDSFRKCVNRGAGLLQPFNFWVISMQQEAFKGLLVTTQHMSEGNGAVGAFCKA